MKNTTTAFCGAASCTRPSPSSTLCQDHTRELWAVLALLPDRLTDLEITRTRQHRFANAGGRVGKANEAPLPFNDRAGKVRKTATEVVSAWQGRLADHLGVPVRFSTPIAGAYWILGAVGADRGDRLARFVDAGPMLTDLAALLESIEDIIDRPRHLDAWFAGRCSASLPGDDECPEMLYGTPDESVITCPRCGHHHDVAFRRSVLLAHAHDTLVTATEAARAITVLTDYDAGPTRLVRRIGMWVDRGRMTQRGTLPVAGKPRPLYRLGDILDLLDKADSKPVREPKRRAAELDILTEGNTPA